MKQKDHKALKSFEVVKIVDLERIVPKNPDTPSFLFRIEILKERKPQGLFHPRVFRWETFRIQPAMPQERGRPKYECSDEHVLVEDAVEDWKTFKGKTADEVLKKVMMKIRDIFEL